MKLDKLLKLANEFEHKSINPIDYLDSIIESAVEAKKHIKDTEKFIALLSNINDDFGKLIEYSDELNMKMMRGD